MITPKPCRIVVLDSFDISTIEGLSQEKTERAQQILSEHNPNDFMSFGVNWSEGLAGTDLTRRSPQHGQLPVVEADTCTEGGGNLKHTASSICHFLTKTARTKKIIGLTLSRDEV